MASSAPFYNIVLAPADVPGAKFVYSDVAKHSNYQLKRWLECRGLPLKGNKAELVKRCMTYVSAGNEDKLSVTVDGGKWYEKKVMEVLQAVAANKPSADIPQQSSSRVLLAPRVLPQPPVLPVIGWKPFPSVPIPEDFCYGTIYHHIIASAKVVRINGDEGDSDCDENDYSTSKPMRKGRLYFTSGHVTDMQDTAKSGHYYLKAHVRASYQKHNYNVSITLRHKNGQVVDSSCECKSSSMGRCSHVSGLLFALEDYTLNFGYKPESCTSKLCSWNVGRKKNKDPKPAHVSQYNKNAAPDRIILFDPRPASVCTEQADSEFQNNFIVSMPNVQNKAMFNFVLGITYGDYDLQSDRRHVLTTLTKTFITSITVTGVAEVPDTVEQAKSEKWFQARRGLITASKCKEFVTVKSDRAMFKLLNRTLWDKKLPTTASMAYGIKNEKYAFEQYSKTLIGDLNVRPSGLWVNSSYPGMGCSPDGLVYNGEKLVGVIEIKCPAVLEKINPLNADSMLTHKQLYSFCCTKDNENGTLKLKENHQYFYQIQMQMAICKVDWCDFIIWSPLGMSVQRVNKAPSFWDSTVKVLSSVYQSVVVPEMFEMRVPRNLFPFRL